MGMEKTTGQPQPRRYVMLPPSGVQSDDSLREIQIDKVQESTLLLPLNSKYGSIHDVAASGDLATLKEIFIRLQQPNSTEQDSEIKEIFSKNLLRRNRNILHIAAAFQGEPSVANECIKRILNFVKWNTDLKNFCSFVNAADKDGNNALYLAVKYENREACETLMLNQSDLDLLNNRRKTPIMKIFKKMPSLMVYIFKSSGSSCYVDGERKIVQLNFRSLISIPTEEDVKKKTASVYTEMDLLANLSFTPLDFRIEILDDTHVKALVWLKWQHYKLPFWLTRIFQILWFLLYSFFLLSVYRVNCPYPFGRVYNFSWITTVASSDSFKYSIDDSQLFSERNCASSYSVVIGWILMSSALVDAIMIEAYPTYIRFKRKWHPMKTKSWTKFIKQILLLCRIFHVDKILFLATISINTIPLNFNIDLFSIEWQYTFASIGIFLAWFQIFLQFGKFPQFKGYIKMLTKTIRTLCVVGLLYLALIIAFAMVFCILLPGVVTYASPFEAILRMSTFTIGEVDFENTFYGDEVTPPASFVVTIIFFGLAVVILHIALLNFLIGVTINEIQTVWKHSEIWQTYTCLWQIYLCETFISNFPFSFCKKFLMNRMVLRCKFDGSNCLKEENLIKFYETRMDKLPKNLRKEIRRLNLPLFSSTNETRKIDANICRG